MTQAPKAAHGPPERGALIGRQVRLEPLDAEAHVGDLFACSHRGSEDARLWDYMPYGPFADGADMRGWLNRCAASRDPLFFAVLDAADGAACGMASYLNIRPEHGVIEVGHIWYAPHAQRTRLPTEAMYLMFREVFDRLGYRRLEWKCNARNGASRRAALRLGFSYEGTFRQHMIVKGQNRDTAWFALLRDDWPGVRQAIETWLAPANFDAAGRQRTALGSGTWR